MKSILAALALLTASAAPAIPSEGQAEVIEGVASVIDGDTIKIHGSSIRLHGIDAPESGQVCTDVNDRPWRCGQRAALALSDRIGRGTVACIPNDTDRYGRVVAECFIGQESLNSWMVREGWAVAYIHYSSQFSRNEDDARVGQRGMWSGKFDMPWDWRQARRGPERASAQHAQRLFQLSAQTYSCEVRKTCSAIGSCQEAVWYLKNCGWGGKLDRDNDGVPCESLC